MQEILGEVTAGIGLLIVTGASAYIMNYFKSKKKAIQANQSSIDELKDRIEEIDRKCRYDSMRVRKAIIILSKRLDSSSEKLHPKAGKTAFEEITRDILTEDY
jgi:ribosomal protein L9|tara:strand:- start:649 stop:957 length:309 start_codon:yes stop_codon:yes gene_type:complete